MEVLENCYVPNNPTALHYFGLDLEPLIGTAPSTPPSSIMMQLTPATPQSHFSSQQQHHHQQLLEQAVSTAEGWSFNSDEMISSAATTTNVYTSDSVTDDDLQDTNNVNVNNLFQFSPCSPSNSNNSSIYKGDLVSCFLQKSSSTDEISLKHDQQRTQDDMADVLLSLKHTIVHPGQISPSAGYTATPSNGGCYHHQQMNPATANNQCHFNASTGSSASLSCTVYPHQLTPLPMEAENYDTGIPQCSPYCNGFTENVVPPSGYGNALTWSAGHSQPIFHAMSVNVSMNMTMHHPTSMHHQDGLQHQLQCHPQMQWTSLTPNPSPVYNSQNLPSPVAAYPACANNNGYPFTTTDMKQQTTPQQHHQQQMDSSNFICGNSACSLKSPYNKQFAYSSPTTLTSSTSCDMNGTTILPPLTSSNNNNLMKNNKRNNNNHNSRCGDLLLKGHQHHHHHDVASTSHCSSMDDSSESCDGKPNLCRICGKTYARPSTLKTHLRTHSGEKPYRCDDCNKSFSQAANLTAHVRTHSGEKPFRCAICDRRFSQSSSVTTHMRTHSGERPYRCRLCKKAFSDSSTLTKHLRIHSGEKPYQCKLCLLRFSQSGNLNRHMRVHNATGTGGILT